MISGDEHALSSLRRIAAADCLLEIIVGIDPVRDKTEIGRLDIPVLSRGYIEIELSQKYKKAGFRMLEHDSLSRDRWKQIETSWAKRLSANDNREVTYLLFEAL